MARTKLKGFLLGFLIALAFGLLIWVVTGQIKENREDNLRQDATDRRLEAIAADTHTLLVELRALVEAAPGRTQAAIDDVIQALEEDHDRLLQALRDHDRSIQRPRTSGSPSPSPSPTPTTKPKPSPKPTPPQCRVPLFC